MYPSGNKIIGNIQYNTIIQKMLMTSGMTSSLYYYYYFLLLVSLLSLLLLALLFLWLLFNNASSVSGKICSSLPAVSNTNIQQFEWNQL